MNSVDGILAVSTPAGPLSPEQGPVWLAHWLVEPPWWVNPALQLLAVVVAAGVGYRLWQRDWRISLSTQLEIQIVVAHVLGIMVSTLAARSFLELDFIATVVVGVAAGAGTVFAAQPVLRRVRWHDFGLNPRDRVMVAWLLLFAAAVVLPPLVGLQEGSLLWNTRWYLVGLSAAMTLYNAALQARQ